MAVRRYTVALWCNGFRAGKTGSREEMLAGGERITRAGALEALPFEWTKDDLRARQLRKEAQ